MKVEIFSDIACPFCYIGTRNFLKAIEETPGSDQIEVIWRSFQLDPEAPKVAEGDLLDHLTRKFGVSRDEAMAMNDRVIAMGHEAGIEFDFESARAVNTFDAHRMLKAASEEGDEAALADSFFEAYFTGSSNLADPEDLVTLAVAAGMGRERAGEVAGSDQFSGEVKEDQELAGMMGITGVPAFVFDRSSALSGAQPIEVMRDAITRASAAAD